MKALVASVRAIIKRFEVSEEEAMKILRVPKAKREAVREQLSKS